MPVLHFQVALKGATNLPEDSAVNNLYFDTGDGEDTADGIIAAYGTIADRLNSFYSGAIVKWYALAGGQPLGQKEYASPVGAGGNYPTEVALCLSYATVDDPEASTGRRRGRIYLPWQGLALRPSDANIDALLDFGEALATIGSGLETTWMMYSQTDASAHKIESIWVDDAYDTQRRRGVKPTKREVRDVQ